MKERFADKLARMTIVTFIWCFLAVFAVFEVGLLVVGNTSLRKEQEMGDTIAETSRDLLLSQSLSAASDAADSKAGMINEMIRGYRSSLSSLTEVISGAYGYGSGIVTIPEPGEITADAGTWSFQYMPASENSLENGSREEIERVAAFAGNAMAACHDSYNDIYSVYYTSSSGATLFYDQDVSAKTADRYYDGRSREWYRNAADKGGIVISDVYDDAFGLGQTVTISAPVYYNGVFEGVAAADIHTYSIAANVLSVSLGYSGYAMLLSEDGKVVASRTLSSGDETDTASLLSDDGDTLLKEVLASGSGIDQSVLNDADVYVAWNTVEITGWKLAVIKPFSDVTTSAREAVTKTEAITAEAKKDLTALITVTDAAAIITFALLAFVSAFIIRKRCEEKTKPLSMLEAGVRAAGEGELDYKSEIHTGDELETLSESFEALTGKLQKYIADFNSAREENERIDVERAAFMEKASHDTLTGLLNREAARREVSDVLKGENGLRAMLLIDLDNFKGVNDTWGHAAGDELLIHFAGLLRETFRSDDTLCRLGGDEFMVFLPDLPDTLVGCRRVEELLELTKKPAVYEGQEIVMSCSVGMAFSESDADDFDSLYHRADIACYNAKKNGKGCYSVNETPVTD